jgi:hypothetical protein
MRFGYIIESINGWFARVVFERDAWDEKLDRWARGTDLRIGWVLHLSRGCVWLTRRILEGLMRMGILFSRRLSRQMEFDADAIATGFAGVKAHREVDERLHELMFAQNAAYNALAQAYREGRLVDDLPALVVGRERLFSPEERKEIADIAGNQPAEWFHTHPSMKDRQAAVARLGYDGVFHRKEPASVLIPDFKGLSLRYTREFYQERLGDKAGKAGLCDTAVVLAGEAKRAAAIAVARTYLASEWGAWNRLPLPELSSKRSSRDPSP